MSRLSRPTDIVGVGVVSVVVSVICFVCFVVGVGVGDSDLVSDLVIDFGVGVVRLIGLIVVVALVSVVVGSGVRRLRERRDPTRLSTVPAPRSLRWVGGLLPGDEGAAWWAEVASCLAETSDPGERRRYMRSYRRNVPRLIWTSWAEHLSASRQRELS